MRYSPAAHTVNHTSTCHGRDVQTRQTNDGTRDYLKPPEPLKPRQLLFPPPFLRCCSLPYPISNFCSCSSQASYRSSPHYLDSNPPRLVSLLASSLGLGLGLDLVRTAPALAQRKGGKTARSVHSHLLLLRLVPSVSTLSC